MRIQKLTVRSVRTLGVFGKSKKKAAQKQEEASSSAASTEKSAPSPAGKRSADEAAMDRYFHIHVCIVHRCLCIIQMFVHGLLSIKFQIKKICPVLCHLELFVYMP